jgi:hypothetical protein
MLPGARRIAKSGRGATVPERLEGSLALGAERTAAEMKGVGKVPTRRVQKSAYRCARAKTAPRKWANLLQVKLSGPGVRCDVETSDLLRIVPPENPQPKL